MLAIANVSRFIIAWTRSGCDRRAGSDCSLLQLIFHFVDAGIDAGLVDAGRTGEADSSDHVVADLDRHAASDGDDMEQGGLLPAHRLRLHSLDELLRGHAEGPPGPGFAAPI